MLSITRKHLMLILLVFLGAGVSNAQGLKRHMADQYFEQYDFSKAAPIYDELAKLTVDGKKQDWTTVRRAAESNYNMAEYGQAVRWYSQLEKSGQMAGDDYWKYFQALRLTGKYDEAAGLLPNLKNAFPKDSLFHDYSSSPDYVSELKEDSASYKIRTVKFNYGLGDYAPAHYKDGVVFVSQRRNSGFVNRKFLWDDSYFTSVYYVRKVGKNFDRRPHMLRKPFKTKPHDGPMTFSGDEKVAVISRNDLGKTAKDAPVRLGLYLSYLTGDKWGNSEPFAFNSKDYSVSHPSLSADGSILYFASDMPGGEGGVDIYKSSFVNGNWTTPVNLGPGVNTPHDEVFPYIAHDETLYFASDGHVGLGGLDVFKTAGNFSTVENVGYPVNSQYDDFSMIVNEDGNIGYFTSNRSDFVDRIYETEIKVAEFFVDGSVVMDNCKNSPVADQKVVLINKTRNTIDSLKTDAQGKFSMQLKRSSEYTVRVGKNEYKVDDASISTVGKITSERFPVTMTLVAETIDFSGRTISKSDQSVVKGVKLVITDLATGRVQEERSDSMGMFKVKLQRNNKYSVAFHAPGYMEGSAELNTTDKCAEELKKDLALDKIKKGDVLVINNIFYDYDKATLRKESEAELDKLAVFLIGNPNIKVELSSHTDSRGGDSYNKKLSQSRAQTSVDYLIRKGVLKDNIVAKGYGESKLVNKCDDGVECDEAMHQQNRRTEIKILKVN